MGPSVSRRAVWISNARTIEIQHGANEPGLGPDDGQRVYNARSQAIQPHEQQSVHRARNKRLWGFPPQHSYLVPKNQYFRLKPDS